MNDKQKIVGGIEKIAKCDTNYVIDYRTGEKAHLNILNSHVFRFYMSPTGEFLEYPVPINPEDTAKINIKKVSDYDSKAFEHSFVEDTKHFFTVHTNKIKVIFDKINGTLAVHDKRTNKDVLRETYPLSYAHNRCVQTLHQYKDEYYFGGGMQNGRFSHKGELIEIVNTNNWNDKGVSSPCPFYWSTYGYGVLRNTWQPGFYDFGQNTQDQARTVHKGDDFDAFYFINPLPKDILCDYYELTGRPLFIPEYAFYEAHLNTFNRDYWVQVDSDTPGAVLFEDGNYYKSYQPDQMEDKHGTLESLNGEKSNYQFSARAMVDRYKKHDIPLGWFVPNDGYGSGYGQTNTLLGDIKNLEEFANYARKHGVEVALWTESRLEPDDPKHPKKGERDLRKEVGIAGVVALKCDVAWIGSGYSFGLSAVENATKIFTEEAKQHVRPLIIMVDGWAGTQRHSGIWSGDQTGGQWEFIRFHIPTYIGTGLSGQPVVGADMDGIYGGQRKDVNVRDFQWKAFTPLQLNMDGWGKVPKTPFSFDSEATKINRAYLKLKSMLIPYNYTIGHESSHGLPMVRAMFLEFPDEVSAYTLDSQYQFMWGPYILVAPVYKDETSMGDSVRNTIYLPDVNQIWIDLLTGDRYQGGKIYNTIKTPLWKMPVFLKDGAIIPMANPNNNPNEIKRDHRIFTIYPNGESNFTVYEDDGISSEFSEGHFAETEVKVIGPKSNEEGNLLIRINRTTGSYRKMVRHRTTIIQIMATQEPEFIKSAVNNESIHINKAESESDFNEKENVYFFKKDFILNPYLKSFGGDALKQSFWLIKVHKMDITAHEIQLKVHGFANKGDVIGSNTTLNKYLDTPSNFAVDINEATATSITLSWSKVKDALYYEIERDGTIFTNIIATKFNFENFKYESKHSFRIRSVNAEGVSGWSDYLTVVTKEDPYKHTVKDVKVTCNIACQPCQEIFKLTDGDCDSLWHTQWGKPDQADPYKNKLIQLDFDLGDVYAIDKVTYTPREDAGNGTFLQVQYTYSTNGKDWSLNSAKFNWNQDKKVKTIELNGVTFRYFAFYVLDAVGGFGSGKHMHFYKKIK